MLHSNAVSVKSDLMGLASSSQRRPSSSHSISMEISCSRIYVRAMCCCSGWVAFTAIGARVRRDSRCQWRS